MSKAVSSKTSVFATGFNHDYLALINSDPESVIKYKLTNVGNSIIAGRVSWFFDFKAPSLTVDTACSSTMVAFHLATQSLRSGESEMVGSLYPFLLDEFKIFKSILLITGNTGCCQWCQ
jgi:acyl transferase domain-containing protein